VLFFVVAAVKKVLHITIAEFGGGGSVDFIFGEDLGFEGESSPKARVYRRYLRGVSHILGS
jgi:hypothetical protein